MISSYWSNLDPDLANAAQLLGASPQRVLGPLRCRLLVPGGDGSGGAGIYFFVYQFRRHSHSGDRASPRWKLPFTVKRFFIQSTCGGSTLDHPDCIHVSVDVAVYTDTVTR